MQVHLDPMNYELKGGGLTTAELLLMEFGLQLCCLTLKEVPG